MRKKNKITIT